MVHAVLAIDLQRDFLEENGRMPIAPSQVPGLIAAVNAVTAAAELHSAKIVFIGNEFPRSQWLANIFRRDAALSGSRGAEIDPRVLRRSSTYFPKSEGNAFSNRALGAFLNAAGVEALTLMGIYADACVAATTRGALREGYRVTLVRDAIGADRDGARDRALLKLERAGARVMGWTEAVSMLAGS